MKPTEEELRNALATIHLPEKRDAATIIIWHAMDQLQSIKNDLRRWNLDLEFDDLRSIQIARFLNQNVPLDRTDSPDGFLYQCLRNLMVTEYQKKKRRQVLRQNELEFSDIVSSPNAFDMEGIDLAALGPTLLEELVTQILPGNCGRMKHVPEKVRKMYSDFENVRDAGEQMKFDERTRTEHTRLREKVIDVVNAHVTEEETKKLYLAFVEAFLRLRRAGENSNGD